jgi:hypothetical protein
MSTEKKRVTIIRAPKGKDNPYFLMLRTTAQDEVLSFEARGVLAYLLSKSDNWELQPADLMKVGHCGRDRVNRIIKELKEHHYLKAEQPQDDIGKFERNVYTLYETPFTENPSTDEEKPSTENPLTGNPLTENPLHKEYRNSENPDSQKDIADTPSAVSAAAGEAPEVLQPETPQDEPALVKEKPKPKPNRRKADTVPAELMNPMKDAIAAAFGWSWDGDEPMTPEESGQILRAAKSLCKARVTPAQVPALYDFCKASYDNFGPVALSTNVSKYRKQHKPPAPSGNGSTKRPSYLDADPDCPKCGGNGTLRAPDGRSVDCSCVKAVRDVA